MLHDCDNTLTMMGHVGKCHDVEGHAVSYSVNLSHSVRRSFSFRLSFLDAVAHSILPRSLPFLKKFLSLFFSFFHSFFLSCLALLLHAASYLTAYPPVGNVSVVLKGCEGIRSRLCQEYNQIELSLGGFGKQFSVVHTISDMAASTETISRDLLVDFLVAALQVCGVEVKSASAYEAALSRAALSTPMDVITNLDQLHNLLASRLTPEEIILLKVAAHRLTGAVLC